MTRFTSARIAVTVLLAVLVLVPAASAVTPLAYALPSAIAARISGGTPQIPTKSDQAPSVISASTCTGLGASHGGKFNSFRCQAVWNSGKSKSVVWARARPGGQFCASSTGLSACPPGPPSVGDPRVCHNGASPYADPNHCAIGAAADVINRAMPVRLNNSAWAVRDETCGGQNLTWSCEFSTAGQYGTFYKGKIKFIQSTKGAWTASFVVTGGGGPGVTCTVLPGTASGTVSRWFQGATPKCSN